MAVQEMTVAEYAKLRNIRPEAVIKALSKGHNTPGIEKHSRFGRAYKLSVNVAVAKKFVKN